MLPCVCSVIDHRRRQNVVRTSVTHSAMPHVPLFCSYHILTSSVIYYWTDAQQHGIYLLKTYKLAEAVLCINLGHVAATGVGLKPPQRLIKGGLNSRKHQGMFYKYSILMILYFKKAGGNKIFHFIFIFVSLSFLVIYHFIFIFVSLSFLIISNCLSLFYFISKVWILLQTSCNGVGVWKR